MIYTLGHTKNYNKEFKDHGEFSKLGKTEDYPGGIIFKTKEDADTWRKSAYKTHWSAWGVDGDWEKDAYNERIEHGVKVRSLLNTKRLIKLPRGYKTPKSREEVILL